MPSSFAIILLKKDWWYSLVVFLLLCGCPYSVFHPRVTVAWSMIVALPGPKVIEKIMLNSTWHEIYPAHKCKNANNCCWHFNIY